MAESTVDKSINTDFDITPDPRVLPMLGEINLAEWRCLAELIDNSVDGFLAAQRAGTPIWSPQVTIFVPEREHSGALVSVTDNGPGMNAESLEKAVRAGFSNNDPINNLGLFGMGFNIATARLGTVTRIYSAQPDDEVWTGLEINFDELSRQGTFRTPRLTRPKTIPNESGTKVEIRSLKPGILDYFTSSSNRTKVRRELGRVYSAMLRSSGKPIQFLLKLNSIKISGRRHCVWGEDRGIETSSVGYVSAFQQVDANLGSRPFCTRCWHWLAGKEASCPVCGTRDQVVSRQRRVHGWVGLQRFADEREYGLDIIRNGRKIEIASKELFSWAPDETEAAELEYPIDDPRNRGRIVGEIHLDHCRVTYAKDRFDRSDLAWSEMVRAVRGEGPFQPRIAAERGYPINTSPIGLLFQAYRRNNPQGKTTGSWARLLFVKDNDLAKEMAKKFHKGEDQYQDDHKWWELVQEADRQRLIGDDGQGSANDQRSRFSGFNTNDEHEQNGGSPSDQTQVPGSQQEVSAIHSHRPLLSLSKEYVEDLTQRRWEVEAFATESAESSPTTVDEPWTLKTSPSGVSTFIVDTSHPIFLSSTFTPLDALLAELAVNTLMTLPKAQASWINMAQVHTSLRQKYASGSSLDPVTISANARQTLSDLASGIAEVVGPGRGAELFAESTTLAQAKTRQRMASQAVRDPQAAIDDGRFLEYLPRQDFVRFFERHPDLFFDGNYWATEYTTLDYGDATATSEARGQLVSNMVSLLADAIWLESRDSSSILNAARSRLIRASAALELLDRGAGQ